MKTKCKSFFGDYKCHVSTNVKDSLGRAVSVDKCLKEAIENLNAQGIKTVASCCGHGIIQPSIVIEMKQEQEQLQSVLRVKEQTPELKSLETIEVCEQGVMVVMAIKGKNIIDVGRECIALSNYLSLAIDLHFNQSVICIYKNTELKEIIQKSLEKI